MVAVLFVLRCIVGRCNYEVREEFKGSNEMIAYPFDSIAGLSSTHRQIRKR